MLKMPLEVTRAERDVSISISAWADILVSVKGYTESVTINELCLTILRAHPLKSKKSPTLKERLRYYELCNQAQWIITEGDRALEATLIYKFIIPLFKSPPESLQQIEAFGFKPEEYQHRWPNSRPHGQSETAEGTDIWYATKDMVEKALKKK
jgi:hypothetical protein